MAKSTPTGRARTYNSKAMNDRRTRIIEAAQALIGEGGLGRVTIRDVSKRAHVALRTLYLYFDNREALIGVAINDFFNQSISKDGATETPRNVEEVLDRFDRLVDIIIAHRNYSAALAPIYFSDNLDQSIYKVLKEIALTHVSPFMDIEVFGSENPGDSPLRNLLNSQIVTLQYSVINEALMGRLPEAQLATQLKLTVLSFISGFRPKLSKDLETAIKTLRSELL